MTPQLSKISLIVLLSGLTFSTSNGQDLLSYNPWKTAGKALEVMQNNELERNEVGQTENIHCNPLLLNGESLDYENFTIDASGELALVKGEPESANGTNIPFIVQVRRDGIIINTSLELLSRELYTVEISQVLAFAQPGDQLIIDPVRVKDWKAKRILKLIR